MRSITIRIDDVCPTMDWEAFARFSALLDKYGIKPLIGVVPDNQDPCLDAGDKRNKAFDDPAGYAAWLKRLTDKGWIVAMHGVHHVYTTQSGGLFPMNHFSEFAGVELKDQYHLIRHGLVCLRKLGIKTDIFMAPGHSFDKNTLRVLRRFGFRYITDGYGNFPYERLSFTFLPISFLRKAELKGEDGITTFVVHPAEMSDKDFEEYEDLFENRREQFKDYSEMLNIPALKRNRGTDLLEYMMVTTKHYAGKII